ncbi:MAG TPA: beta/gamma crystallin-related protein [Anaerolineae bacterium]|nr:beta/gamma crystallin-related protein [Anaerolineae bacterium]
MTDNDQKTRHTGAAASFIARAKDKSNAQIVAANQNATQQQAEAQQRAASRLNLAHAQAAQTLGQNLQGVFLAAQNQVLGVDANGNLTATLPAAETFSVALDPGAKRVYWTQIDKQVTGFQPRPLPEPEKTRPLRAGEVALYQDGGYGGTLWVLNANVMDFRAVDGLNDQVSSLRVGPNTTVTLYEQVNFQGRQQTFNADTYSIGGAGLDNDTASSLRIAVSGSVPSLTPLQAGEVALYEHVNYQGRCWMLNANTTDFQVIDGLNDQISSLRIGPNTRVTLYANVGYQGTQQTFQGDAPNLIGSVVGNDAASSLQISRVTPPPGLLPLQAGEVALYQHVDYGGKVWVFNRDIADFRVYEGLNDQISSIRVGADTTATLYEHVSYQGRQQAFKTENRHLGGTAVGSDTASSLQIRTETTDGASLFTGGIDGKSIARSASVPFNRAAPPSAGAIAIDIGRQRIFWVTSDGAVYSVAFNGATAQRLFQIPNVAAPFWALVLDTVNQRLYWSTPDTIGQVDYDGSKGQILMGNLAARYAVALAVDARNGYLYWNDGRSIQRTLLARFKPQMLFPLKGGGAGLALDAPTQLLYWIEGGMLFRADMDGSGQPETVTRLPKAEITGLALLTTTEAASDRLTDAQATRQAAQVQAQQDIAQAHQDATGRRQAAHDNLKDAHTQATAQINDANGRAASRRQTGQQKVQDAHTEATRSVQDANISADAQRRQAHTDAQAHVSSAQQQASQTTGAAQAKLDDARRKKQNS